jgi:hypothetical protein
MRNRTVDSGAWIAVPVPVPRISVNEAPYGRFVPLIGGNAHQTPPKSVPLSTNLTLKFSSLSRFNWCMPPKPAPTTSASSSMTFTVMMKFGSMVMFNCSIVARN